jgi:hypothetical protein
LNPQQPEFFAGRHSTGQFAEQQKWNFGFVDGESKKRECLCPLTLLIFVQPCVLLTARLLKNFHGIDAEIASGKEKEVFARPQTQMSLYEPIKARRASSELNTGEICDGLNAAQGKNRFNKFRPVVAQSALRFEQAGRETQMRCDVAYLRFVNVVKKGFFWMFSFAQ